MSNVHADALHIASDAQVFSGLINEAVLPDMVWRRAGEHISMSSKDGQCVNVNLIKAFWAAKIRDEVEIYAEAAGEAEVLLVDVPL